MTAENEKPSVELSGGNERAPEDGHGPLVMAAGLGAALVAGIAWAALAMLTRREIGIAAWGVGLVVGLAMSRVTARRTRALGYAAGALAVVGLLVGRVVIFAGSAGQVAREIEADTTVLGGVVSWQMYDARELDQPTLEAVDALNAADDTMPDALWASMHAQGTARLAGMSAQEKHDIAVSVARSLVRNMGIVGGIRAQLTLFDLLWLLLAVGTAYRFVAPPKATPVPATGIEGGGPAPAGPTDEG